MRVGNAMQQLPPWEYRDTEDLFFAAIQQNIVNPAISNLVTLNACVGLPGATVGGIVGDICFRQDASGALTTIYRCTTAGAVGAAVWTGIV